MRKIALIPAVFLFAFLLFADGGGGVFLGRQQPEYPFFDTYPIPNNSMGLTYYGGYGYGVSSDNGITGGFGVAIVDHYGDSGVGGGFGGIISGVRLMRRPLNLQILNCAGLGGLSTGGTDPDGFFGFFDELTLELGIPLTSWFMPVFYAGYQVVGRFDGSEDLLFSLYSYTPVVGMKIVWGDFK